MSGRGPHAFLQLAATSPFAQCDEIMGRVSLLVLLVAVPLLAGCEKAVRNMYDQPKYRPLAPSPLWSDGRSSRPLEPRVVAHSAGALAAASSGRQALQPPPSVGAATVLPLNDRGANRVSRSAAIPSETARPNPLPISMEVLQRGEDRYNIYCAPCHSVTGDGDGMVVRRGFPRPPSLHTDKFRKAPDAHLFDVITYGYGVMYPFEDRIVPQDRWAVVAYIRALQLSQNARLEDLPIGERGAVLAQTK